MLPSSFAMPFSQNQEGRYAASELPPDSELSPNGGGGEADMGDGGEVGDGAGGGGREGGAGEGRGGASDRGEADDGDGGESGDCDADGGDSGDCGDGADCGDADDGESDSVPTHPTSPEVMQALALFSIVPEQHSSAPPSRSTHLEPPWHFPHDAAQQTDTLPSSFAMP